jgi:hypothetical protein
LGFKPSRNSTFLFSATKYLSLQKFLQESEQKTVTLCPNLTAGWVAELLKAAVSYSALKLPWLGEADNVTKNLSALFRIFV